MRKSLFAKLFIGYFCIIVALSFSILFLSFRAFREQYINTLSAHLHNLCVAIEPKIMRYVEQGKLQELNAYIKELGAAINTRLTVVEPEGRVLADSEEDPAAMNNHKNRPEIISALTAGMGRSLRFSSTVGEEMLYVALPLRKEDRLFGTLRTSLFLKEINAFLGNLKTTIINAALIAIVLSVTLTFFITRRFSRPLSNLISTSKKIAEGDFDAKIQLDQEGELLDLARSFNEMTERIRDLFAEQRSQKEELLGIIASIQEPLLVLDRDGKIILTNDSFKKIVNAQTAEGKFYWEVLRKTQVIDLIQRAVEAQGNFTEEIELQENVYLVSVGFLDMRKEVVLILHDVTEIKKLEKVKKDFVVNVSHELRTPLTAIKGFVETLEEDASDHEQARYLAIIRKHTDRLINIVQDLISLSELEEASFKLQTETVSVPDIIEEIVKIFEQRLKKKNIAVERICDKGLPLVQGDVFRLEQMFINLVDNAIKYTEKGKISIRVSHDDGYIVTKIQDTGIGISPGELSRIFERFYVVDKSRSKELGGTGLGLAIVKHIISLHAGKIDVKSTPGEGTCFTVFLPCPATA
ncbi:MAG: HAMP domain-containing protein [Candidatus Omnitrophica bacterium]|nr:HAMP domain-containing protein [Candidatus Omnitrophota bacterium]